MVRGRKKQKKKRKIMFKTQKGRGFINSPIYKLNEKFMMAALKGMGFKKGQKW